MSATQEAITLLGRLRAGDAQAQAEFCEAFEPYIRREVRLRLKMDAKLSRVLDSIDVCQEVLKSFLLRTQAGEYDLQETPQLMALLKKMLRNKLSKQRRWHYAERRTLQRQQIIDPENWSAVSGHDPSVSRVFDSQETLKAIMQQLSQEEQELAQARANGDSWNNIAERLGSTPDALRMKLGRALEKVIKQVDFLG